jgi:hypothetical protein
MGVSLISITTTMQIEPTTLTTTSTNFGFPPLCNNNIMVSHLLYIADTINGVLSNYVGLLFSVSFLIHI